MSQKKKYSRNFIILQEDEKGYGLASDKAPTGYAKLEVKNNKCRVSFYVQNLKKEMKPYYILLICDKKDNKKLVKLGELNIDNTGRAEISKEFVPENIADSGLSVDKVSGAAIVRSVDSNIISVLNGFSVTDIPKDWKRYTLIDNIQNKNKEENNKKENQQVDNKNKSFQEYEEKIEKIKASDAENKNSAAKSNTDESKVSDTTNKDLKKSNIENKDDRNVKDKFIKHKSDKENKHVKDNKDSKENKDNANGKTIKGNEGTINIKPSENKESKKADNIKETKVKVESEKVNTKVQNEPVKESKTEVKPNINDNKEDIANNIKTNDNKFDIDKFKENIKDNNINKEREILSNKYIGGPYSSIISNDNNLDNDNLDNYKLNNNNYGAANNDLNDNILSTYNNQFDISDNKKIPNNNKENVKSVNNDKKSETKSSKFFNGLTKHLEKWNDDFEDLSNCKWYKLPVKSIEDMYKASSYNRYTILYYPMISYFPYIIRHGHYMFGYKYDNSGKVKYIVYAIPGTKAHYDQPFGGKFGFVSWAQGKNNRGKYGNMGYWLLFYDFRKSVIVIPVNK